ncbi:MAG: isoprenylcysteine carboxylmethyltransferase family protein [Candidatus Omnitrophota bacterium]
MAIKDRFKRWFKLRFAIMYPFGIFVIIFANSDDKSIMAGIWFILAGLFIRLWANGYAIKMEKLTTSGPYAFVRHPLYLGTMLLVIGFTIMLKIYYIGALFIFLGIWVYSRTVKKEETMLADRFKDVYLDYKKSVPAIIPAIFPYKKGEKWGFSFKRLIKNQEYKLLIWMIILSIVFHLKDELIIEHEKLDLKIWIFIIAAFLLGMVDIIGEFIKSIVKKQKN